MGPTSRSACRARATSTCWTPFATARSGTSRAVTKAAPRRWRRPSGKLTGAPGICLVTRGPARRRPRSRSTPPTRTRRRSCSSSGRSRAEDAEREAFQEIDYRRMLAPLAKWVAQVDQVERIPELTARAFRTATSGRPGPVVLALPEDVLAACADVPDAMPYAPAQAAPAAADLARARALLQSAERPLAIVGGQPWSAAAGEEPCRMVRRERHPRRGGLALPGLRRQRGEVLCGPSRDRRRPGAPRPSPRRRRAAGRRRASRRHRDRRLHDHRPAGRRPRADPRPPRPGRDRQGLRAHGRDRRIRATVRRVPRASSSRSARARGTST